MSDEPVGQLPKRPLTLIHGDLVSGIVVGLAGALCTVVAWRLPFGSLRAPDAGFFPISLSVLLTGIGLIIVGRALAGKTGTPIEFPTEIQHVGLTIVMLLAFAATLERIGYVLGTSIVLLILTRFLGAMSWRRSALIVVPSVLVSYLAFRQLGVPLPAGVLPY